MHKQDLFDGENVAVRPGATLLRGRALPLETLRAGSLLAAGWEAAATAHLRAARRGLKAPCEGMPDAVRLALRAEVKALELKAEQALMQALEALALPPASAPASAREALERAIDAWSFPAPASAIERLAQALSSGAP